MLVENLIKEAKELQEGRVKAVKKRFDESEAEICDDRRCLDRWF